MAMSTSFRLFSTKLPQSLLLPQNPKSPIFKTLISSIPIIPITTNFSFFNSISIQRIPTKPHSSSSSSSTSVSLQPIKDLPPKLQEIVKLFQAVPEPKAKYEQLLFYGKGLKPLNAQFKTAENKVQGCVSQVWVRAFLDPDRNVVFEADSDSVLTKGLAALLVQGLSGRPVDEILRVSPDFVVLLGLQQSLTPSRNNGFLNMLKLMQKKALQVYVEADKNGQFGENPEEKRPDSGPKIEINNGESKAEVNSEVGIKNGHLGGGERNNPVEKSSNTGPKLEIDARESENGENSEVGVGDFGSNSRGGVVLGSRGERIRERLETELKPIELVVEDISYQHAGHAGVKGSSDGETHFNVKVVSNEFEGKSLVKRHRLVYGLLQDELQSGLHALSIMAKTPSEVDTR